MSEPVSSLLGAALALIGALFFLASALGLLRLPDFYTRAHAPAKAATLGVLLAAVGSALRDGADGGLWLDRVLLIVFVLITVPIGTQMLVRGATARGIPASPSTRSAPVAGRLERLDED